jgi:CRISPR/Cas system-associated endonuclease Cas1
MPKGSHLIPEYGRHLQKLIDQATAIEDTEERNKAAKYIIQVMGSLNPHLRDVLDFQHKLWDQLFYYV